MDYFIVVVRHCTLYEKNSVEFVYAIRIITYHLDSKNLKLADNLDKCSKFICESTRISNEDFLT